MRFLLILMLALPVVAQQEPETLRMPMRECKFPECVMVPGTALMEAIGRSNANYDRALRAEARVKELEDARPKCAEVTVTEPSKAPKMEPKRPPPPPFELESNT